MRQWYESLESRERLALIAGALVLGVFMVYMMILKPAYSNYEQIKRTISEQRATASWMEQSAARVKQLTQGARPGGGGLGGRSLLAVTDTTARAGGLAGALKRVEPEGSNGVRVWLEGASFDDLVTWLGQLNSKQGIIPESVSLERKSPGRVDVRLTLQAVLP